MGHLGFDPKQITDKPRLGIFPFSGSAGQQNAIRLRIANLMQDVVDASIADPRHFIKGIDHHGRAARHLTKGTGPNAISANATCDTVQERRFSRAGLSEQDHDSRFCQKVGFRQNSVSVMEPSGNMKNARNLLSSYFIVHSSIWNPVYSLPITQGVVGNW